MSQNNFKVKKGLNLQPIDLLSLENPQNGDIACDINDNNKIKYYDETSSSWKQMGGGSPSLDVVFQLYAEEKLDEWSLSSGFNGIFEKNTTAPMHGEASYKYTQGTSSLNDLAMNGSIQVDPRFRGTTCTLYFPYTYDGNNGDIEIFVQDPNGILASGTISGTNGGNAIFKMNVPLRLNTENIAFGFKVLAANNGKVFQFDDVQLSSDTTIYAELLNITDWEDRGAVDLRGTVTNPTKGSTVAPSGVDKLYVKREGDSWKIQIRYQQTTNGTAGSGDYYIQLPNDIKIDPIHFSNGSAVDSRYIGSGSLVYGGSNPVPPQIFLYPFSESIIRVSIIQSATVGNTWSSTWYPLNATISLSAQVEFKGKGLTSSSPHVLTPSDTFSTDTAPLTYASSAQYTLSTLANAPVGTYITFTYAANTNTRTQTTTRPTQTDADMNVNGIQIFTRAFNAASTAANPAAIAIQIGKGMKGTSLGLYKSAGKTTAGITSGDNFLYTTAGAGTSHAYGIDILSYDEKTGVIIVDAGYNIDTRVVQRLFQYSDGVVQNNGYLTINAGKTLPLLAVPTPQVAYLKDVKPSGTAGGTFTAGAWQTRTLNTVEGDSSIVSLSANQFTLGPGKYVIDFIAPSYLTGVHKAKIYNNTNGVDVVIGSSEVMSSSYQTQSSSSGSTLIVINVPTTFSLMHRSSANGNFGNPSSFGVSEVYAQVKIVKLV